MNSTAKRVALLLLAGMLGFWILPWLIINWSGHQIAVLRSDGGRSQTGVVDFSPRPVTPLPAVDPEVPVRDVIFLMADGMGFSQLYAARLVSQGVHGRLWLERFPVTGWQTNAALDDVYTDSAASASSLFTGAKVDYRALSIDADGRPLPTLAEILKRRGYRVGLITDSYLWDASLAAFAAHQEERYYLDRVAEQLAESDFDLLVGTWPDDDSLRKPLPGGLQSLVQPFHDAGYAVHDPPDGLPELNRKTLLLYPLGSIAEGKPALAALTEWALERLSADGRPVFLFVESEEADPGSHFGDFRRIVNGVLSVDEAARVAVGFAAAKPGTLVLATADHETGGFSILSGSATEPLAIRWATSSHTAQPVPLLAYGAGSQRFSGVLDNTEIAPRLLELLEPPGGVTDP